MPHDQTGTGSSSELYDQLVSLVAAIGTPEQQQQSPESETSRVDGVLSRDESKEKLEALRAAYRILQHLAEEIKPTIDDFFNDFSDDTEPTSDDKMSLITMNSKLNVFLAFCPGIRMAYQMQQDNKRSEQSGARET